LGDWKEERECSHPSNSTHESRRPKRARKEKGGLGGLVIFFNRKKKGILVGGKNSLRKEGSVKEGGDIKKGGGRGLMGITGEWEKPNIQEECRKRGKRARFR